MLLFVCLFYSAYSFFFFRLEIAVALTKEECKLVTFQAAKTVMLFLVLLHSEKMLSKILHSSVHRVVDNYVALHLSSAGVYFAFERFSHRIIVALFQSDGLSLVSHCKLFFQSGTIFKC